MLSSPSVSCFHVLCKSLLSLQSLFLVPRIKLLLIIYRTRRLPVMSASGAFSLFRFFFLKSMILVAKYLVAPVICATFAPQSFLSLNQRFEDISVLWIVGTVSLLTALIEFKGEITFPWLLSSVTSKTLSDEWILNGTISSEEGSQGIWGFLSLQKLVFSPFLFDKPLVLTSPGLLHDYGLQIVKGPIDCKEDFLFHFQKIAISVFMPFLCFLLA